MEAVVWEGRERVAVADVPEPELPGVHGAIVRVSAASICGSDLHLFHETVPVVPGTILGHEAVGVVEAVGSQVTRVRPGDRVLIPAVIGCGSCPACRAGYPVGCTTLAVKVFGVSPLLPGTQAEKVAVPYADFNLWPLPAEMEDGDALLLTDIYPTGLYAAENASIAPGDVVLVIGCGPVGLCAIQCAQLFGPSVIAALDPIEERRCWAQRFGATVFATAAEATSYLGEITGGRGANAVIEAVGSEATLHLAMDAVSTGGRVSMVGVLVRSDVSFPLGSAFLKDISFRVGLVNVPRYLGRLEALVRHGRLQPRTMLTHSFSLAEAPLAYRTFDRKLGGCLKVCLRPATWCC